MKPVLDVPFVPEQKYIEFLNGCGNRIDSIQFSLDVVPGLDNRVRVGSHSTPGRLAPLLKELPVPRKYGLLNSRFYGPELFADSRKTKAIIAQLDHLAEQGVINGIVYCDHYLLQLLSDEAPDLAASLEAVPSINTMLDSFDKVESQISFISETRFRLPGKVILDRSLNRDLDRLAKTSRKCREQFPQMKIELLANEGCLDYCPFKLSHDAYIGLSNYEQRDCTYLLNKRLGCVRLVDERPYRILRSPFIRPENVAMYSDYADAIKLCGRTLGSRFLQRAIVAYLKEQYNGNLLDLLDALSWLAPSLYVDNPSLSFDFVEILSLCDKKCSSCGFCKELFPTLSCPLPLKLTSGKS